MMSALKIQRRPKVFLRRKTKRRPFIPWMITAQMSLVNMNMLKSYSWEQKKIPEQEVEGVVVLGEEIVSDLE